MRYQYDTKGSYSASCCGGSRAKADIYKWCFCCDQTLQTVLCRRQTSVNTKTTLIRFASYLSHRLIAIYIEDYMKLLKLIIIMYNMTGIAKFYNKFCHSSNRTRPDPLIFVNFLTRPDPTRPAGRPDPRATLDCTPRAKFDIYDCLVNRAVNCEIKTAQSAVPVAVFVQWFSGDVTISAALLPLESVVFSPKRYRVRIRQSRKG